MRWINFWGAKKIDIIYVIRYENHAITEEDNDMRIPKSGIALGCAAAFTLSACSDVSDVCMLTDEEFQQKIETKSVVTGYDQQLIGPVIMLSPQTKMVKRSDDEKKTLLQERSSLCAPAFSG